MIWLVTTSTTSTLLWSSTIVSVICISIVVPIVVVVVAETSLSTLSQLSSAVGSVVVPVVRPSLTSILTSNNCEDDTEKHDIQKKLHGDQFVVGQVSGTEILLL